MLSLKTKMAPIWKSINNNLSVYVYLIFIASIYACVYAESWLKSYEKPTAIVVDSKGNIPEKENQEKERKQGSAFWENQLELIEIGINAPERLIQERNKLNAYIEKIDQHNQDIKRSIHAEMNEKHPELGKVQDLQNQKNQLMTAADRAISQAQWELLYEQSLRRRDEYIQLKEIVSQRLIKARHAEGVSGLLEPR